MPLTPTERTVLDGILAAIAAAEAGPGAADLMAAPLLDPWRPLIGPGGMPVLWGRVSGHPDLMEGEITTSRLIRIDPARGWARTASRWYRLGRPLWLAEAAIAAALDPPADGAPSIGFAVAGCVELPASQLLEDILARYIRQVRQLDTADARARADGRDRGV